MIPPASLSANPLTRPGPRTARVASSRTRQIGSRGSGERTRGRGRRRRAVAAATAAARTWTSTDRRPRRAGLGLPLACRSADARHRTLPAEDAREALLPGRRDDRVDRVVDGHDPDQPLLVVDDGHGQQVVVGDDLGDLVLVGAGRRPRPARGSSRPDDRVSGWATIRSRSERTPDEPVVLVGHVDVVDRLGVGLELAQPVDRLGGGQVLLERRCTRWS